MNVLLLLLAIVPGIILSFLIIKADRFDKEPPWLMATAFISGALITYPTMLVEGLAAHSGWDESRNFFKVFFFALIFVGLIEEFFKFICLGIPYFRKEFNEPMDGIVYAVLIAMGFATAENIMYADRFGLPTVALRAFTAVPAHGTFAIVMGYYVGLSKQDKKQRYKLILFGLSLSAFLHGVYDFFIIQPYAEWLMSLATLVLVFCAYLAYRMVKLLHINSPFNLENNPPDGGITNDTVASSPVVEEPLQTPSTTSADLPETDVIFTAMNKKKPEEE
jgi:RsiW-degrading membrane proteinase PrsW (M82 family)